MQIDVSGCQGYLRALASMDVAVGDFYLLLGHAFAGRELPAGVRRGQARMCYQNAAALVMENPRLAYCEGYARPDGLIPVHHAWCVTESGDVIDPTWTKSATAEYYGIALGTTWLMAQLARRGTWGLLAERIPHEWLSLEPHIYLNLAWLPDASRLAAFDAKRREWLGRSRQPEKEQGAEAPCK